MNEVLAKVIIAIAGFPIIIAFAPYFLLVFVANKANLSFGWFLFAHCAGALISIPWIIILLSLFSFFI